MTAATDSRQVTFACSRLGLPGIGVRAGSTGAPFTRREGDASSDPARTALDTFRCSGDVLHAAGKTC